MPSVALAKMTTLASLVASVASAAPPTAECVAARASDSVARLPDVWRAAVDDLIRSTTEPAHPWGCSGGTIDLKLNAKGALIGIAREGEEAVWRQVASADDVVPLGEALLARPLASSNQAGGQAGSARRSERAAPTQQSPWMSDQATSPVTSRPLPTSSKPSRHLLISAGIDGRGVGGSGVGWLGPTASAGLALGRWLPSISLRQESAILSHGPPITELSGAVMVQSRFELSPFELRTGVALRGAAVLRDLPRRHGEQSSLEGRIGVVTSFVIPVFRWGSVVLSADGEVVGVSRESTAPAASTGDTAPASFPTYTLGGNACLEVPL